MMSIDLKKVCPLPNREQLSRIQNQRGEKKKNVYSFLKYVCVLKLVCRNFMVELVSKERVFPV